MEQPLLKAILERVILFFVPIALGYIWRAVTEARATGKSDPGTAPTRPASMSKTTTLWLAAVGAALVGVSLIGGVFLPHAPDRGVYVPGEVRPGGTVSPSHFAPARTPSHD
jgi:hypothetical protein